MTPPAETIDSGIFTSRLRRLDLDVARRVLVVDDDELELELVADRLKYAGLEVVRAHEGAEALRLLEHSDCAVMVVDWQMPGMDGIELTERLRAGGKEDIYIIMLTARGSGFDYDRGYLAGVDDYLTKKLPDTELMARIHTGFNMVALRHELKRARARIAQLEAGQR
jgi:DNA-binding response OmpR family regulator